MESEYALSEAFAGRIEKAYSGTEVVPIWIGDGNKFWYRRTIRPSESCFVFVDPEQGIRRPAFDHDRLAKELSDRNIEAKAHTLPFTWIDPSNENVKFRIGGRKFQFSHDCRLSDYDGDINEEILKPLSQERVSEPLSQERLSEGSTTSTAIDFVNLTARPVSLIWIDYDGELVTYAKVEVSQHNRRHSHVGHVWRVADAETGIMIGSFVAQLHESVVIIEDDMTIITKPMDNCTNKQNIKERDSDDNLSSEQPSKIFVKDYNVWYRQTDQKETQLSTNGTKDNAFDESKIYESPNTPFVVVYQYTPQEEHLIYQVESSPKDRVEPRLHQFQYLKAGDKNRSDRPRMFDLTKMREIEFLDARLQNPLEVKHIGWSLDGKEYRFGYSQGDQIAYVIGVNTNGNVRYIIEEKSDTFIDFYDKVYCEKVKGTEELIWASERDGWNHLYLFDLKLGNLKNRLTQGEWVVHKVDRIEEDNRRIWITVLGVIKGQDPYYKHLARVNLDGSEFTILTKGEGTHTWKWTRDHTYLIDTWSRVDMAPQTALLDAENGQAILQLEESPNLYLLHSIGWTPPIPFSSPGRDDTTMIYGIIIIPPNLDPNKKYPILEEIYAGPTNFSVPKAFSTHPELYTLAALGFVIVLIDGMGKNWRHKAFHDVCYKNIKDAGFPDRIAWMKAAARIYPWMDLSRVGIYGYSAGGQNAMGALLWHGDFYKAAMADCGCHDQRMNMLWWSDQFMGPLAANEEAYKASSNVVNAGRLKGKLMLVVGELDRIVDPASTMQVVNALNKAKKHHELVVVPGGGHCVGTTDSHIRERWRDFFVRHLMDVNPPTAKED
ncbi:hypothetical protein G7Y79_00001g000120 [Physcia stellaris]|nr:hypothetical protein G7Y79_00001g000120 [Physcia stellaris]